MGKKNQEGGRVRKEAVGRVVGDVKQNLNKTDGVVMIQNGKDSREKDVTIKGGKDSGGWLHRCDAITSMCYCCFFHGTVITHQLQHRSR